MKISIELPYVAIQKQYRRVSSPDDNDDLFLRAADGAIRVFLRKEIIEDAHTQI